MKSGKRSLKKVPTIINACAYGTEWVKWWTATQPQECETKQWPFPRDSIDDVSWSKFPANGKDGIFLAIMGLSWWPFAIQSLSEVAFFEEAVTEIHWVVREIIRIRTHQTSSPPLPPSQDQNHLVLRPPVSSSRSRASSSRPPASTMGAHTHSCSEGKRAIKPTWKALASG